MREIEITLDPASAEDADYIRRQVFRVAGLAEKSHHTFRILRRSLDARKRPPKFVLRVAVGSKDSMPSIPSILDPLPRVHQAKEVHIIGAGPAGYFAALECIELGLKPVVFDRGKDVQTRRRDLRAIQQEGIVNPDSNYCFGEGGAGTYSDGKLYTRSGKRGSLDRVLQILVEAGAPEEILYEAHPHIGSNKLPPVIAQLRHVIEEKGGEVRFEAKVTDLILSPSGDALKGIIVNDADHIKTDAVILATGHSARDVFDMLVRHHVFIEAKPFALGVRIEHPQTFIDGCQYGQSPRDLHLPAASYAITTQALGRGVFSFCMCPGGLIVPAATSPGELVVNGMSLSRRDSPFANSGLVTAVEMDDLFSHFTATHSRKDPLIGIAFQREVEQRMFAAGDGTQAAPAQLVTDFIQKNISSSLPPTSYIPGIFSAPLHQLLPEWIYTRLVSGLQQFHHKMKGYIHPEAIVVGTESRTSSPVRIPRDPVTGQHIAVKGLFPCGEGAGYAGGIMSAAMDGQWCAQSVHRYIHA